MFFRPPFKSSVLSSFTAAVIALLGLCSPTLSIANDVGYHITDKQHLGGDAKWDCLSVDEKHRHLFITHGDRVEVYDIDKKQIAGKIPNTNGVHAVAVAADLDLGFTSNGKEA